VPSFPWRRILRLLAIFREMRSKVRKSNKVGKTENWTGLRMYKADRSTTMPSVMLTARSKSRPSAGTGTIIMNMRTTVATGTHNSLPPPARAILGDAAAAGLLNA
jgi:hypothetical protein